MHPTPDRVADLAAPAFSSGPLPVWFLAYTKPRQEAVAQSNLQHQGFDSYLPLYKMLKRGVDGAVLEPMFPRYLLFRPGHAGQSISAARSTRGVMTLVRFGVEVASLPDDTVLGIREVERVRNLASAAELSPYRAGQGVRVVDGALRGLDGLVQEVSSKRVVVLLQLLGRPTRLQIDPRHLAIA